jgi:hypothetical protein
LEKDWVCNEIPCVDSFKFSATGPLETGLHALLNEAINQSCVKVDACTPKLLPDTGVSRRHGKTKNTAASWVFAFTAHTLTATDWLAALIGPLVVFS